MVAIEGLAVNSGIGLKDCMPIEVLTKSKTEILLKNGAILDRVPIEVSILDEIADVEVDTDNSNVDKTKLLTGAKKIIEQIVVLTIHGDEIGVEGASLVAKEVTINLTDEVVDTSIVFSWSWEVVGED